RAWDRAQRDYRQNPVQVRSFEAKRINMAPEQFDALIEGQTVAHPSFEEIVTAEFMGPPGGESESRLMKHLHGIGAFLVAEKRIQAVPTDWNALFNTRPIQTYLAARQ
ncbi:MAG TPA: aliphatic sulfonates ABC transporter substrate-binding protein, partial [Methylobacterium sp.]